jgi:carbon monoxide dehydrogenase subunit G
MAADKVEISVPATPDKVWALVGDFEGLGSWFPGIGGVRMDGDDRLITAGDAEVRERLLSKDDATMTQRYSVVEGMPGLERHEATITVAPEGDGSHVTWAFDVSPDEAAPVMVAIYSSALGAVRDHFS